VEIRILDFHISTPPIFPNHASPRVRAYEAVRR
jgi:hypothetical protein